LGIILDEGVKPLKIVPMGIEAGIPLIRQPTEHLEPLHHLNLDMFN
jgi:hypothetical protein